MSQCYPPPKVIAVDVDGTLHHEGRVNERLVDYLRTRKAEGYRLMLWSARGLANASAAIERFGLHGLFDDVLSKPGYIIADLGWSWIKYTKVIRNQGDAP